MIKQKVKITDVVKVTDGRYIGRVGYVDDLGFDNCYVYLKGRNEYESNISVRIPYEYLEKVDVAKEALRGKK